MSIATLKRKSSRYFTPVSTTHFSLSGTHRNVRQFNNTNLSALSSICHLDSDCTGNTVKTTSGYFSSWRNPVCLYGQSSNPDYLTDSHSFKSNSPEDTSQSSHINTKRRLLTSCPTNKTTTNNIVTCGNCVSRIGTRIIYQSNIKEPSTITSLTNSSSNYTSNGIGRKKCLPNETSNIVRMQNHLCG